MELMQIQDTIVQVAQAITAALEIETEIIDDRLLIVGGTGRYVPKIGTYEEEGKLDSGLIYGRLLQSGEAYVCKDAGHDLVYNALEGELAEICCPIRYGERILGLIGLVAFNEFQRKQIIKKTDNLLLFLNRMAELIVSKLIMTNSRDHLKIKLDSILQSSGKMTTFSDIIGVSRNLELVKQRGMQVAMSDSTVLIRGESGCGKELFARAIHSASARRDQPFVSVNCGAIPEMLLESELFGYEKGAFTGAEKSGKMGKFELADDGTIFLDEIGDLPLHLQVKLLSAIQNRQIDKVGGLQAVAVNVRIIAATNKNLEQMIETRQFREDLYFRLNVIPLDIPPLRERPEDVELLLVRSLDKFNQLLQKQIRDFTKEARDFLLSYDWPGNVRELENVVEYAVNMEDSQFIQYKNLPDRVKKRLFTLDKAGSTLKEQTEFCQRKAILSCLDKTGRSLAGKRKAAEILRISESSLYRKMRELDISRS